jgi:hypothetical protein
MLLVESFGQYLIPLYMDLPADTVLLIPSSSLKIHTTECAYIKFLCQVKSGDKKVIRKNKRYIMISF